VSLRELWDRQAESWAAFARTPGHDVSHEQTNFPPFLELLPPPGRATLDVGCGEGRVGGELQKRGHKVVGVDSSPRLVELAKKHHEAVVADAAALPFADGTFDLVIAYMSLMNMDDMEGGVREAARVLEGGGRFCFAVLHPLWAAADWPVPQDHEPARVPAYFDAPTKVWTSEREGITMTFHDRVIPLETYSRALEAGGLVIESLREIPSKRKPQLPLFLHVRALKVALGPGDRDHRRRRARNSATHASPRSPIQIGVKST
jgi:ubiquinone/menaquinone biosynthesis C-methylase UbiE